MPDPALPASLAATIADLERRLRVVESTNRLHASSIRGGALQVLEADGDEIATIGELPGGGTGLRVRPPGESYDHLRVDQDGVIVPAIPHSWRPSDAAPVNVTSGTFASIWGLYISYPSGPDFEFQVGFTVPVGTTMEMRLRRPATGTTIGTTLSRAGTGVFETAWYRSPHGMTVRTTTGVWLGLEVRVASGAGTISVYWPAPCHAHGLLADPPPATWTML